MSLSKLSEDWRGWVALNVERKCSYESMLKSMTSNGISKAVAKQALKEAQSTRSTSQDVVVHENKEPVNLPGPVIDSKEIVIDCVSVSIRTRLANPNIIVLDNVLLPDECAELIRLGTENSKPVSVVDPETGKSVPHNARSGTLAHLTMKASVLDRVESRISQLLQWPIENFEHLQAIHYEPGEEYRPHFDWFDVNNPGSEPHLRQGGQRVGTLIMYLAEPEEGGSTSFPSAGGFTVSPKQGSAVWFRNVDLMGNPDRATLHAGDPVTKGSKWIATAWLRERAWRSKG